jgi:hypothetical protein
MRGAVVFAWSITVFVALSIVLSRISFTKVDIKLKCWWQFSVVALMALFVLQAQRPDVNSWKGFIERDKWELLDWIDKEAPSNSVISSIDIEDAYLLPIYTKSKPLYTMYGLTNRTLDEELRRYFFSKILFEQGQDTLEDILNLQQKDQAEYWSYVMAPQPAPYPYKGKIADAVIALNLVIYYPYISKFKDVFTDPLEHQKLENMLDSRLKEARLLNYRIDFIIHKNTNYLPAHFKNWPEVYKNRHYSLLKNPSLSISPAYKF